MVAQCQHLDGRVVIRGRDGAPGQLRRGLLGVGVFVAAVVALSVLAFLGLALLSDSSVTEAVSAVVPTDLPAATELLVPLAPLFAVYLVGALGFLVYWRRRYDIRVEVREGLLGWD